MSGRFWIVHPGYHALHEGEDTLGTVNKVGKQWRATRDLPTHRKIGDFPTWQRAREAVEAAAK